MGQISLQAHAKINLTLDVVGCRDDGYHLLKSVMQSLSLADIITIDLLPRKGIISISADTPDLPTDERNICWRAASAFLNEMGSRMGVFIGIEKRIPMAAGLGGGSSDAAAVLIGLNELFARPFDLAQLQALGLSVGADVPFCLQGGTALVEGIGEKVTAVGNFSEAVFVLVKPKASVSTAQVYGRFDRKNFGSTYTQEFLRQLEANAALDELSRACGNVLETVTLSLVPEVQLWKERLLETGALTAVMSGSGPTVFGIFAQEEKANQFCLRWQDEGEVYVARPVPCGVLGR